MSKLHLPVLLLSFLIIVPLKSFGGTPWETCPSDGIFEDEPIAPYELEILPSDNFLVEQVRSVCGVQEGYDYYQLCFDYMGSGFCSSHTPNSFVDTGRYCVYLGKCRSSFGGQDNMVVSYVAVCQGVDCSVSITPRQATIGIGQTIELHASTTITTMSISWSAETVDGDAKVEIAANNTDARVEAISGTGRVAITATNAFAEDCKDTVYIDVQDCSTCADGSGLCSDMDVKSLYLKLGLGKTDDGFSAGKIILESDLPDPRLSNPTLLNAYASDGELIEADNILRQIVAPQVFVDIHQTGTYSYAIDYYYPLYRGDLVDGVYEILEGAQPFASWAIENPDASSETYNRLRITENRDGNTTLHDFEYDTENQAWQLSKGNGALIKTLSEQVDGDDRITTETIKEADGTVVSKKQTTYHTFSFDSQVVEEIVQVIDDPDGAALITTTAYNSDPCAEGSCGRIQSQVFPDGSWVRFEYDEQGRKIIEVRPFKNQTLDVAADSAHAIYYDYTSQTETDADLGQDIRLPRKITENHYRQCGRQNIQGL